MAGSTGSRILWAGLLAPPLLLLMAVGAVSLWPDRVVGMMAAAERAWSGSSRRVFSTPRTGFDPTLGMEPVPERNRAEPVLLRGTIRTPDGALFRGAYVISESRVKRGRRGHDHSASFSWGLSERSESDSPKFTVALDAVPVHVAIAAEGYAPVVLGEYSPPPESVPERRRFGHWRGHHRREPPRASPETVDKDRDPAAKPKPPEPVEVALKPGFSFEVRVVDSLGAPILGAEVTARMIAGDASVTLPNPIRSDDDGRAVFDAVSDADYEFEVNALGFRYPDDAIEIRPKPGGSTTIALKRGPVAGVALDEDDRPVADVLLLVAAEMDGKLDLAVTHGAFERIVLAKSGADGRFVLPALHDDSAYLIRAEGPAGELGFAQNVRRGGGEVKVTLRPRRLVRAIAPEDAGGTRSMVTIRRSVPTGFDIQGGGGWDRIASSRSFTPGADGRFEYSAWGSVDTELEVGGRTIPVPWPPPAEPFPIDGSSEPARERGIRLQLVADAEFQPVHGTMTLHLGALPPERAHQDVTRQVEVRDGQASFTAMPNEWFRYDADALPGYWIVPGRIVANGTRSDRYADIRALAAGAISGRVLNADGSPAGAGMKIRAALDPAWVREVVGSGAGPRPGVAAVLDQMANAGEAVTDADGRFRIHAVPVGAPMRLEAASGYCLIDGGEIRLDPGETRRDVAIHLPKMASVALRILDPDGSPLAGAKPRIGLPSHNPHWSRLWPVGETDADGRLVIDDLSEGGEDYKLEVRFAADYQPIIVPLRPGDSPVELRAERGATLEGRVVEAVTGWPIPGLSLRGRPIAGTEDLASAETDSDGRFRMSTLPAGPIRLSTGRNQHWLSPRSPVARAGASAPVLIRLIDLRESDPQPRPVPEF